MYIMVTILSPIVDDWWNWNIPHSDGQYIVFPTHRFQNIGGMEESGGEPAGPYRSEIPCNKRRQVEKAPGMRLPGARSGDPLFDIIT